MAALTVEEATARILGGAVPLESETIDLADADGRVLRTPLVAHVTAPPFDASAMDGYAVSRRDLAKLPVDLRVVGEAAAGHAFLGSIGPGEAVRIFTGAPLPTGADAIVIQENTRTASGGAGIVHILGGMPDADHIRPRGGDFEAGALLLDAGRRFGPREITLAAAMGHARVDVARRPRVAVLATGDELVLPGTRPGPSQIVASNHLGVMAIAERAGGLATFLGIARDSGESLDRHLAPAESFDVLVTIGGASVGDHDLVAPALARRGMMPDFWRIAMRPGKPLMFGRLGATHVLGLPGNPVSALTCALLFLGPLVRALAGELRPLPRTRIGIAGSALAPNGPRAHYMRAIAEPDADGRLRAVPVRSQDSSLLAPLAAANVLLIRPIDAPAIPKGHPVPLLSLDL